MIYLSREEQIIQYLLSLRGITRYRLTSYYAEGKRLPGSISPLEVYSHSAYVVTPEQVYFIWLDWAGEEQGYYTLVSRPDEWAPINLQEEDEDTRQQILKIQQEMKEDPQVGVRELCFPKREPGRATEREESIIGSRLRGSYLRGSRSRQYRFENYELMNVRSGGHDLVGSLYPGEVQDITAILVMPYEVCCLTLDWDWGQRRYTFGEKTGAFRLVQREEYTEEVWNQVEKVQCSLREKVERELQEQWAVYEQEYWELNEEVPDKEAEKSFWQSIGGSPVERAACSVLDLPHWEEERDEPKEQIVSPAERQVGDETRQQRPPPSRVQRKPNYPSQPHVSLPSATPWIFKG